MSHTDTDGAVKNLFPDVATAVVMKTLAVSKCGGPAKVTRGATG
jgi:hypothetical protein